MTTVCDKESSYKSPFVNDFPSNKRFVLSIKSKTGDYEGKEDSKFLISFKFLDDTSAVEYLRLKPKQHF